MIRCLFIHQAAELYGSDRVLLELVTTLRLRGVCEPVVVVPEDGALVREMRLRGIEVHIGDVIKVSRAMFKPMGMLKLVAQSIQSLRAINRIVAGRHIDVVHSNTLATLGGALWAAVHRTPHVWHVHEIINEPRVAANGFAWLLRMFADHVVAISRMTLENLTRRQPAIAGKSTIIWNGLDAPPLVTDQTRQQVRAQFGLAPGDVLIGILGRINEMKGHGLLLDAAAIVRRQRPELPIKYLVVGNAYQGKEHLLTEFLARRAQLGLQEQVIHHDFVDKVWPIWAAVDVGVVPSTQPEGFGMVAIEAMAMGKPVIGAAHGGVLDIIVEGQTGYLVPPCQAEPLAQRIIDLADDAALRSQMGLQGQRRVAQEFSMEAQAGKFEAVYQRLAERGRSR